MKQIFDISFYWWKKGAIKIYADLSSKIRVLIGSITNRSHDSKLNNIGNYDEKHIKVKSNSDDD